MAKRELLSIPCVVVIQHNITKRVLLSTVNLYYLQVNSNTNLLCKQ